MGKQWTDHAADPYRLKRFAVDFLRRNPRDIYRLSQILGHSSVKTTEIYLAYVGGADAKLDHDWPHRIPLPELTYDEAMSLPVRGHKKGHNGDGFSHEKRVAGTVRKGRKAREVN